MRAGDTVYPVLLITDAAGVAVTGLTGSALTLISELDGASSGLSFSLAEIGSGRYRATVTAPSSIGFLYLDFRPVSGSHFVSGGRWAAILSLRDEDDLYAAVARPAYLAIGTNTPLATTIDLVAYRQTPLAFTVRDQNGTAIPGTGYSNFRFTIRTINGASSYSLSSGITWDGAGLLSWTVPENASIFSQIDAEITAGKDSLEMRYDIIGDAGGSASATRSIMRGTLRLLRYEGAA